MTIAAVIQARMGSTRLPGKMMLPLRNEHVLTHVIRRVLEAEKVDTVCVATSTKQADDILARYANRANANVFRGSESDVLDRVFTAAKEVSADVVVRITGDCPLIDPDTLDTVVEPVANGQADYAANIFERTFPRGLDVEAFTFESFRTVDRETTDQHHREHVTPYYREERNQFVTESVTSEDVFDEPDFQNRYDLRLTLDEADDYEILRSIYENVPFDNILPIRDAIQYVDKNDLMELNADVRQKTY